MKIIDAHIHFHNHKVNKHSFLDEVDPNYEAFVGDYSALPRIYLPENYLQDTEGFQVAGVIWHEFISADPIQEAKWAQKLEIPGNLALAMVTLVDFLDPDLEKKLETYRAMPSVTAVREHLVWDPVNPKKRFAKRPDVLKDSVWQKRLSLLKQYDFKCGLEVFSHQLPDLTHVVQRNPEIQFTIALMGWPIDLSPVGFEKWKQDMKELSRCENTCVDISAIECIFGMQWTLEQISPWILETIEAFGANRTMFGSHLPISKLSCSFKKLYDAYFAITANFSSDEKESLFHRVAAEWFKI
ncbi:MAG: hypothetical protein K1000chlam3_00799 [Chlamydiae bacterium]|nr:hypothetical protein [Chlamydiota bacterium]